MLADMWDLWPSEFEETEIGEIPLGWRVGAISDVASVNPESWSRSTRPVAIRYIDLASTKRGRIESVASYDSTDAPSRAQRVLRQGDTVFGTVRPGNAAYTLISEDGLTGSTGFAVLRPNRPEWAEFVYLGTTNERNVEDLASLADGSAYPAVSADAVAASPIALPPEQIVRRYSSMIRPFFNQLAGQESQSRTLAAARDALLPKLLSGEIRVPIDGGK
jgi:type I restriction enzyme S subunit